MKVSELLLAKEFDVNAEVKLFAGGPWNDGGRQVGSSSCGTLNCPKDVLHSNIVYITTDCKGAIVVECDSHCDAK